MKKRTLFLLLCVLLTQLALAQHEVQLAGHRFVPDQNVQGATRGSLDVGTPTGGSHNVLIQLDRLPSASTIAAFARQGLLLGDYLGGNAYFALFKEGAKHPARMRGGVRITSIMPLRPEWKIWPGFAAGQIPSYARVGDAVEINVLLARNAPAEGQVRAALSSAGAVVSQVDLRIGFATVQANVAAVSRMARLPWVLSIQPVEPEQQLTNLNGRTLGRAHVLNAPYQLGGRGLLGKGVRVGIWDGNVVTHPDFGDRVHVAEYEMANGNEEHGTHVAGSVLGAGVLDPWARGMAPEAQAWTYNFNRQSNGKTAPQEMYEAIGAHGITMTQNSYGTPISRLCNYFTEFAYRTEDYILDRLAIEHPTVTHVYAAGNDQAGCASQTTEVWGFEGYGTVARRSKNIITIAAVEEDGYITGFSSLGPQDDGRLAPTVAAKGGNVYSVKPGMGYQQMSGTSMACPTATGHMALITERYRQVYSSDPRSDLMRALVANTADDAGRKGPDFVYGYGILNAERAVIALEKGYFAQLKVGLSGEVKHRIPLPANAKGLRVMVVWNDPAVRKVLKYGDSPLINDLDLTVRAGSKEVLPWVLNSTKWHVRDLPQQRIDTLNNMEQVTLTPEELAGLAEVEVSVKGTRVVDGEQEFALVWWIDMPESLRIVAPIRGDEVATGRPYAIRLEGITGKFAVEVSADGGKTYQKVGESELGDWPDGRNLTVRIPSDLPVTSDGRLRVVDIASGRSVEVGNLILAPRITGVKLDMGECGYDGWKLTWTKDDAATQGYVALRYDEANRVWVKLGEIAASETTYNVPTDVAKQGARSIFAVAAKTAEGAWGLRSRAAFGTQSQPVQVAADKLPIYESFTTYPSALLRQGYTGKQVRVQYRAATLADNFPIGSNTLWIDIRKDPAAAVAEDDLFDRGKNKEHFSEWTICELDLTQLPEGAIFHLEGGVLAGTPTSPRSARMRLLSNGKPLPSQYPDPKNVQHARPAYSHWYFALEGGQKHSLKLQFAGQKEGDVLAVTGIAIEPKRAAPDLTLRLIESIEGGPKLGKKTVKVRAVNSSDVPAQNIELRGYVNGKWQATHKIDRLEPRADAPVELLLDLSAPGSLGAEMEVKVEVLCPEDINLNNNTLLRKVQNLGDVLVHPISDVVYLLGIPFPSDPYQKVLVDRPMIYTDHGGVQGDYPLEQRATLRFASPDPEMCVRVTFTEFDTREDLDHLLIYTSDTKIKSDGSVELKGVPIRDALHGESEPMPRTYVSEASDGSLAIQFISTSSKARGGWVARVDLVPKTNALTLVSASAILQSAEEKGQVPVRVTLRNNYTSPLRNVRLFVWDGQAKYYLEERIPLLQPGDTDYTFEGKIEVEYGLAQRIRIYVECDQDYDASDNALRLRAINDSYCTREKSIQDQALQMGTLKVYRENHTLPNSDGHLMYLTSWVSKIYQEPKEFLITMKAAANTLDTKTEFAVWIDWDDNKTFDPSELVKAEIAPKGKEAQLKALVPEGTQLGPKRMRLMFATPDAIAKGACASEAAEYADVRDMTLELLPGLDPAHGDIALLSVDAGGSGHNLKANQDVKIWLQNRSLQPFKGKIDITMRIDGKDVPCDPIDCAAKPLNPNQKQRYTLSGKIDLSAQGYHYLTLTIDENGSQEAKANNTINDTIYCAKPKVGGFYALDLRSATNKKDRVEMVEAAARMGNPTDRQSRLIEVLVNLHRPQEASLAYSPGFGLFTEDGKIFMRTKDRLYVTPPLLHPGVWHHIAVSFHSITENLSEVDIYVDGKRCEDTDIYGSSSRNMPAFDSLTFGRKLDGLLGMVRLTQFGPKPSGAGQIKSYMYDAQATGMEGYVAGYGFNEGPTNRLAFSAKKPFAIPDIPVYPGRIQVDDETRFDSEGEGALWVPISKEKMFAQVRFEGQVGDWRYDEANKRYLVKFPKEYTDEQLQKVKVESLLTVWPKDPKFKLNDQDKPKLIGEVCDLSGAKTIKLKATHSAVFGNTIEEEITIAAERDLSAEAELKSLTIAKEHNAGLLEDITPVVGQRMLVRLNASTGTPTDIAKVHLKVVVSEGAEVYYLGQKAENNELRIDLRHEALFTVRAANGHEQHYALSAQVDQRIEGWSTEPLSYQYGDVVDEASNPIGGVYATPSELPVSYVSDNPKVASVAGGLLRIGQPGSANIKAVQLGEGIYRAAESAERPVAVGKKPITVTANIEAIYNAPIAWKYEYSGLVKATDVYEFPDPIAKRAFRIKNAEGLYFAHDALLPAGEYTLEAQPATYETDLYTVTPVSGTLRIVYGADRQVTFTVEGMQDDHLDRLLVKVGRRYHRVGTTKRLVLPLRGGERVAWRATAEGYQTLEGEIAVPTDADAAVALAMRPVALQIEYKVDPASVAFGDIVGALAQSVAQGGRGDQVMAQPKSNCRFVKWNDGNTNPIRREENVQEAIAIVAEFAQITYQVKYLLAEGGKLKAGLDQGLLNQMIVVGKASTQVEVEAEDGYYFIGWSDGTKTPIHSIDEVKTDVELTARFGKLGNLPAVQDFELGFSESWYSEADKGLPFAPASGTYYAYKGDWHLDGTYAAVNSVTKPALSYLYSTRYKLDGLAGKDLVLSFDYLFRRYFSSRKAIVEYRLDGENWTQLEDLAALGEVAPEVKTQVSTIAAATLGGKRTIQFRWKYDASSTDYVFLMDNVSIFPKEASVSHFLTYEKEPAAGGRVMSKDGSVEISIPVSVDHGTKAEVVVAQANDGYHFLMWKETGSTDPTFAPSLPVMADATYTALFRSNDLLELSYRVVPAGQGSITEANVPSQSQLVERGKDAKAIVAVPAPGYRFVHWEDGSTAPTRTVTNVQRDMQLVAYFEPLHYEVRFVVKAEGKPVEHALAVLPNGVSRTNANGVALATLPKGRHYYEITAEGYDPVRGTLEVVDENLVWDVDLKSKTLSANTDLLPLTFVLSSVRKSPIYGATVAIEGLDPVKTTAEGEAEFLLKASQEYSYTITHDRYVSVSAKVAMAASPQRLPIELLDKRPVLRFAATTGGSLEVKVAGQAIATGENHPYETQVAIKPMAEDGYYLTSLMVGEQERKADLDKDGILTITLKEDVTIQATFALIPVKLQFLVTDGTNPLPDAKVTVQDQAPVFTDAEGKAELMLEPRRSYTYSVELARYDTFVGSVELNGEKTVNVTLEKTIYPLTFSHSEGGTLVVTANGVEVNSGQKFEPATKIGITVKENDGYVLSALRIDNHDRKGELVGGKLEVSLTAAMAIEAQFTQVFTVTFTTPEHGTLTVKAADQNIASGSKVTKGTALTLTAKANEGYQLASLKINGSERKGDVHAETGMLTITVDADQTIEAAFDVKPVAEYTVTFATPENGTLTVKAGEKTLATGDKVTEGIELAITATPATGYQLASLQVNGTERKDAVDAATGTLKVIVEGDVTIATSFTKVVDPTTDEYAVTFAAPEHGTLTVKAGDKILATGDKVAKDTELAITAKPATGYLLASLQVNGTERKADVNAATGTLTVKVEADVAIAATFSKRKPSAVDNAVLAQVAAYPNPFSSTLQVEGLAEAERILLLNAEGKPVRMVQLRGESELTLEVSDLPAGVYLLQVERGQARRVLRVVKQ